MVRFSRFRTRSRCSKRHDDDGDDMSEKFSPLIPANKCTIDGNNSENLRRLRSKEQKYTVEDQQLQNILSQINAANQEENEENLTISVGMIKQRTNSTSQSSTRSVSSSAPAGKKEPLWKRKLSRLHKSAPNPQESLNELSYVLSPANYDQLSHNSVLLENEPSNEPIGVKNTRTALGRQRARNEAPNEDEPAIDVGPIGLPRIIYSVVKSELEEFSVSSPSLANTSVTSQLSKDRIGSYRPGCGDSVSSLGRDDEFHEEGHCSVSSLANDALRSAALMLLQCNDGCSQSLHARRTRRIHS
mmetsp:Transcript_8319/g.10909  ORF Transcript_8319/g.10909 Transcript_8319/m.10909 type:complete len:301 (-) Transcript_8319:135-1037(-)